MPDEHEYNKEAENIDEIKMEDRQERMAKEKARASHFRYLRYSAAIKSASLEMKDGN